MKRISAFLMVVIMVFSLTACGVDSQESETDRVETETVSNTDFSEKNEQDTVAEPSENFVLITGGTFEMGSPDREAWRSEDETQHTVTV